jgi:hypothetical protein
MLCHLRDVGDLVDLQETDAARRALMCAIAIESELKLT